MLNESIFKIVFLCISIEVKLSFHIITILSQKVILFYFMGLLLPLIFFIVIATITSYIDYKKRLIPDKIILPSIIVMLFLKWESGILSINDFIAMVIVIVVFIIPILFGMVFGGGDIRFGAFCALFVGLEQVGVFIALSGIVHLLILAVLRKKSFAFAPAMTLASLIAYMVENI